MARALAAIAVLSALALATAPPAAGTVTLSELISFDELRGTTFTDELEHEFSQKPPKVRVTLELRLKKGAFSFRVETPDGRVVWRETLRAKAKIELRDEFPGEAGNWRVVLDSEEARGRYKLRVEQVR